MTCDPLEGRCQFLLKSCRPACSHLSFRLDWADDLAAKYGVTLLGQ